MVPRTWRCFREKNGNITISIRKCKTFHYGKKIPTTCTRVFKETKEIIITYKGNRYLSRELDTVIISMSNLFHGKQEKVPHATNTATSRSWLGKNTREKERPELSKSLCYSYPTCIILAFI